MKENELNLDILENADRNTTEYLSEHYTAVSESDISRMFNRSEELFREKSSKDKKAPSTVVSGVDIYHRPVWSKILAAASAIMLLAGAVTGGMYIVKNFGTGHYDTSGSEYVKKAPFGDISESRIRFTSPAYFPYLYEASPETVKSLAEAFNVSEWEEIKSDIPRPDGECTLVYVNNNGQNIRLEFYGESVADCEINGKITKYRVSEDVFAAVYKAANPEDTKELSGNLIWSKIEDLTPEGAWKNNEPVPEKIFEEPGLPDEFIDKEIIDYEGEYHFAYDFTDTEQNAAYSDDLIIGKVNGISYKSRNGVAYTQIEVTVSEDITGKVIEGDNISLELAGGYVSVLDTMIRSDIPPNDSLLKNHDIENTYYHEIAGSGQLPIIGKEYAFFVSCRGEGSYNINGQNYGMLYKCDNLFIQSSEMGFNFYDMEDLKSMMENNSADAFSQYDTSGINEQFLFDVPVDDAFSLQ